MRSFLNRISFWGKEFWLEILLIIFSSAFFLFSYLWLDLGLVLMLAQTRPYLRSFLYLIELKNTYQETLGQFYLVLVVGLFLLQVAFLFNKSLTKLSTKSLLITAMVTTLLFSLAYPFLSYDIFTYLFSAKMVWTYHANPYTISPERFIANDLWVSFMRNIQFTYAYGPVALLYSLIPMIFFSGKRFILNFFGLKLMNAVIFYFSGLLLLKLTKFDKRIFAIWFFNPFLTIELLINAHNDLLMIGLFFVALFFVAERKFHRTFVFWLLSVLTKYASLIGLPAVLWVGKEKERAERIFRLLSLSILLIIVLQKIRATLPWYYTWVYMFLPFANLKVTSWILIASAGLLLLSGYLPFVERGVWTGGNFIFEYKNLLVLFIAIMTIFNERRFESKKSAEKILL